MFLQTVKNSVGSALSNGFLKFQSVQPELMLFGGIAAGAASVVMIAKAHRKSEGLVEELKDELTEIEATYNIPEDEMVDSITEREMIEAKGRAFGVATARVIRLYGPGVVMGIGGLMLILGSHGLMKRRAQALIGLATLLETSFAKYRERVKEEYGPEVEARMFQGSEARPVTVLSDDDGKKTKKKVAKNHIPEQGDPLMYDRIFDETNRNWKDDPDLNIYGLYAIQNQMHDILQMRGQLVLNEVYRKLGFDETDYGAVVGWLRDGDGDGYVNFGLEDDINQREGDNRWHLSFNVDGVIWDKIGMRR